MSQTRSLERLHSSQRRVPGGGRGKGRKFSIKAQHESANRTVEVSVPPCVQTTGAFFGPQSNGQPFPLSQQSSSRTRQLPTK